jgi:hypothetical protein
MALAQLLDLRGVFLCDRSSMPGNFLGDVAQRGEGNQE